MEYALPQSVLYAIQDTVEVPDGHETGSWMSTRSIELFDANDVSVAEVFQKGRGYFAETPVAAVWASTVAHLIAEAWLRESAAKE